MSDPLSVSASVIAIASLAYFSCKSLHELISTIGNANEEFEDLNQYLKSLSQILDALRTNLDSRSTRLTENQIACLEAARPTLEGCSRACAEFKTKMEGLTAHSQDGRRSFRDSIKMHFHSKSIADFRTRVVNWKESLSLALDVVLLTSLSANTDAFKKLEIKIATAEAQLTTDLKMVNKRLEKLLTFEPESEEDLQIFTKKTRAEEQQKLALVQCLTLWKAAVDFASQATGHSFKNNQAFGEARAIYGNIGVVPTGSATHLYQNNSVSDNGRVVYGNMDSATFLKYMKVDG